MNLQIIIFALSAFLVSSCSAINLQQGAAAGAVVNQATEQYSTVVLIGAKAGAVIKYLFGSAMDKSDQDLLSNTYEYNLDRQTSKWSNVDSGNTFEVTPRISYVDSVSGLDCREAEIISNVEGEIKETMATACRKNGVWVFR